MLAAARKSSACDATSFRPFHDRNLLESTDNDRCPILIRLREAIWSRAKFGAAVNPGFGVSVGAFWQGPFQKMPVTVFSRRRLLLNGDPVPSFPPAAIDLASLWPSIFTSIGALGKIVDSARQTDATTLLQQRAQPTCWVMAASGHRLSAGSCSCNWTTAGF